MPESCRVLDAELSLVLPNPDEGQTGEAQR